MKSSFTVNYKLAHKPFVTVLGVTSIVPNLNGFLFFTEDGEHHQIENHELDKFDDGRFVAGMCLEYSSDEDIAEYFEQAQKTPDKYKVYDHRER